MVRNKNETAAQLRPVSMMYDSSLEPSFTDDPSSDLTLPINPTAKFSGTASLRSKSSSKSKESGSGALASIQSLTRKIIRKETPSIMFDENGNVLQKDKDSQESLDKTEEKEKEKEPKEKKEKTGILSKTKKLISSKSAKDLLSGGGSRDSMDSKATPAVTAVKSEEPATTTLTAKKTIKKKTAGGEELTPEERKKQKAFILMRKKILDELLETEESYVNNLNTLQQHFITPLEKSNSLTESELFSLVSNWAELVAFHADFFVALTKKAKEWSDMTPIFDLFEEFSQRLSIYKPYMANYNRSSLHLLYLCKKSGATQRIVKGFEEYMKRTTRLPIESVFIMPIQRIPRYILLLKEMKKYTFESHPDYEGLPKVATEIENILLELNKHIKKGEQEEIKKVQTIFESVEGDLHLAIDPQSRLLRETSMTIKEMSLNKNEKAAMKQLKEKSAYLCHLFADSFLICKYNKGNEEKPYRLEHFWMTEEISHLEIEEPSKMKAKPAFTVCFKNSTKIKFRLQAYEDALGWIGDIERITKSTH